MKAYPLAFRAEVIDWMRLHNKGPHSAAERFNLGPTTIIRWRRTQEQWRPKARAAAALELIAGGESTDANGNPLPTISLQNAFQLKQVIQRNITYLATDEAIGSARHLAATRVVTLLAKDFQFLLAVQEEDLSSVLGVETPSLEESEADAWVRSQLTVLAGGVTGEAK